MRKLLFSLFCALTLSGVVRAESWPVSSLLGVTQVSPESVTLLFPGHTVTVPLDSVSLDPLSGLLSAGQRAVTVPYDASIALGPNVTLTAEWRCADGSLQRVVTECFAFHKPEDCVTAHKVMCDAMKAVFPPVRPQ